MADRQPRGPSGLPVVGNSLDFAADPLGFSETCAREYGDVVRFDTLDREVFQVTDPEGIRYVLTENDDNYRKPDLGGEGLDGLLGDGLLTSEGDDWLAERRRVQPAFGRDRLDSYAETMVTDARELADSWSDGDRIDAVEAMSELTLRIVVETLLGVRLTGLEREISDALTDVGRRFRSDEVRSLVPEAVPTPRNVRYRRGERRLERVARDLIRQRERRQQAGNHADAVPRGDTDAVPEDDTDDVLGLLLRARDAGAAGVDDELLRDEVLTMLLAGHDTTALTLTYSWYLLSEHPEAERRFHDELDEVLSDGESRSSRRANDSPHATRDASRGALGDSDPTPTDARELEYTERVVKEAMRLYPPAFTIYREAEADDSVAGFRVPAGGIVSMPQWVVHRDPRWWDDPDEFRPERWADGSPEGDRGGRAAADRPEYAYFPFGGGPRRCVGERFALREAKLVLATLGRRFRLDYAGSDEPELIPTVTLHPEPPVTLDVRAHRRTTEREKGENDDDAR